jgi:hypothetical protein
MTSKRFIQKRRRGLYSSVKSAMMNKARWDADRAGAAVGGADRGSGGSGNAACAGRARDGIARVDVGDESFEGEIETLKKRIFIYENN